jgi:predicted nucleic acid-binding protein
MTYLFDTDILIDFFKLKEPATALIKRFLNKDPMAISALSVAELRAGWSEEQARRHVPRLYTLFAVEDVTKDVAEQAGSWRQAYKPKGITVPAIDALIAATAYLKKYCLVTNNTKDYPMPELKRYEGK